MGSSSSPSGKNRSKGGGSSLDKGKNTKTTMGKGQNEGGFSEDQLEMYKECFKLMDINKDGTIDKNDLRGAFDNVGKLMTEDELDDMLGEVGGACTYDAMVQMFQTKMAGEGNDPDDLIVQAFKAYDIEGKIDAGMFKHALMTWGDKFSASEVDDIFGEFEIDEDNMIKSKDVIGLFVAQNQNQRQSLRKMRAQPRRRRRRRRPPSKAFIFQRSRHHADTSEPLVTKRREIQLSGLHKENTFPKKL